MAATHFNPRSPRGERRDRRGIISRQLIISIHAPREGSDINNAQTPSKEHVISIHAPREGSDENILIPAVADAFISIHAPREGSDG